MKQLNKEAFMALNKDNSNLSYYNPRSGSSVFYEERVNKNFAIHNELQKARFEYNAQITPKTGDVIKISDTEIVYISMVHDTMVQTTAGGSFSIFKAGYMSYSGGLDSGLKKEDLKITTEKQECFCWFPEGNDLRAHCAIYTKILVRVWEVKKGANLSGVRNTKKL